MMVSSIGRIAEMMGFSRPLVPPLKQIVARKNTPMAYVSGCPDFSEKLALDPGVCLDVSGVKIPLAKPDDTNVAVVSRRWGMLDKSRAGAYDYSAAPHQLFSQNHLTPLYFVSALFRFWRGTIRFKVEFVANALIRQRYAIYIVPPLQTSPVVYAPSITFKTIMVDIAGRTEVIVDVPYMSPSNYQTVDYLSVVSSTAYTRIAIVPIDVAQGFTGTPPDVRYNVYVSAGDDYELANPFLDLINQYVITQGKTNVATFGESVTDLLQLTRRPVRYTQYFPGTTAHLVTLPMYPLTRTVNPGATFGVSSAFSVPISLLGLSATYTGWIGSAYLGMSGGMRYKLLKSESTAAGTYEISVTHANCGNKTSVDLSLEGNGRGCSVVDDDIQEVELPMMVPGAFVFAARYFGSDPTTRGATKTCDCISIYRPWLGVSTGTQLYQSAAEDFILKGFLCTPTITAST